MSKIKNALISVSDKEKLKSVLEVLKKNQINIISSGGTYKSIKKLGFKCEEVSEFTGFKEMLDGRVKTLHPKIHAGILFKRDKRTHKNQMRKKTSYHCPQAATSLSNRMWTGIIETDTT